MSTDAVSADPSLVPHQVNAAGTQPRGVLRWGYFLILNAISGVLAVALFIGIFFADGIDPYMRGTYDWLLAHPGVTSFSAFSPLLASLLVGFGYSQRARKRKAAAARAAACCASVRSARARAMSPSVRTWFEASAPKSVCALIGTPPDAAGTTISPCAATARVVEPDPIATVWSPSRRSAAAVRVSLRSSVSWPIVSSLAGFSGAGLSAEPQAARPMSNAVEMDGRSKHVVVIIDQPSPKCTRHFSMTVETQRYGAIAGFIQCAKVENDCVVSLPRLSLSRSMN